MADKATKERLVELGFTDESVRELFNAFDKVVLERLPIHNSTVFEAALFLLCKLIVTSYDDPNRIAKYGAETLVKLVAAEVEGGCGVPSPD